MANSVRFKATLDDQVTGKLGKIRDNFDRLGKSKGAATVLQGVGIGAGISAWGLLNGAIGKVTDALADGVRGAIAEEAGIARLNAALKANVAGWNGATEGVERQIKASMRLGFADDELRDSLATLVPATRDVAKAFRLQSVAMDLARFSGSSLEEASAALVKVEAGQFRLLKGLGVQLKDNATQEEALAEVQRVTAGQNAKYLETTAAKLERVEIAWGELTETVGGAVVPAMDAAATATLGFGDAIDTALGGSFEEQYDLLQRFTDIIGGPMGENMRAAAEDVKRFRDNVGDMGGKTEWAADRMADLGDTTADTTTEFNKLRNYAKGVAKWLRETAAAADEARDALFESSKGPEETALQLEGARLKGRDLRDELAKLEAVKHPTRDTKQDIIDTKLAIIDNQEEVITLRGELVKLGGISLAKHENTIKRLGYGWDDSADELARYLSLLGSLPGVTIPRGTSTPHGAMPADELRASGGPVLPGRSYIVGEEGPERLVMGSAGGYVIPNGGAGSGSPVVVQLNLDGREIARVVDRHLYYEAARAPLSPYAG